MVGLIISAVIFIVGIAVLVWDDLSDWGIAGTILGGFGVFILGALLIFSPMKVRAEIREYHAVKTTLSNARANNSIENAALQTKVMDVNIWLASKQYWNSRFPAFYPDEIETLEPLK